MAEIRVGKVCRQGTSARYNGASMCQPSIPQRPAVHGVDLDPQTRCRHWHGPTDILAIRFRCCNKYYACYDCHAALAGHPAEVWPAAEFDRKALLCGACGAEHSIATYLGCSATCPACGAAFNPRCSLHHHYYFQVPAGS
jgi:uncharacterized CHY-type Zn-finger protein